MSTIALRISLTSKKYCLSISSSLLGIVCNTVLSSAVSEFIVSRNIPSAIELILFSILSGLNVVASKRNCTLTFDASSSTISIPTSLRINPRILSLSSIDIADLPLILIISYPRRYAPVTSALMFSSFATGYSITTSFGGLLLPVGVIEMVPDPVSSSTSSLFSNLFAKTHSIGNDTRMLLPIFCRRRMNLVNLY